jgi:hypothetical protein
LQPEARRMAAFTAKDSEDREAYLAMVAPSPALIPPSKNIDPHVSGDYTRFHPQFSAPTGWKE